MTDTLTVDCQWSRAHVDMESTSWHNDPPGTGIPFIASTSGRARDGLVLRSSGWRTDRYERNGVLLWCHKQAEPPIGRAETQRGNQLCGLAYFDQEDEFALKVERKYRAGVMNGFSVGWAFVDGDGQTIDWRRAGKEYLRDRAFYDLTEISAVPVPSDPQALTQRARSGMRDLTRQLAAQFGAEGGDLAELVRAEVERLGLTYPAPAESGIDPAAARAFLAAFEPKGEAV